MHICVPPHAHHTPSFLPPADLLTTNEVLTRLLYVTPHRDLLFVTDVSWRSALGQGGGEAFSLRWDGSGVVSIQPAER